MNCINCRKLKTAQKKVKLLQDHVNNFEKLTQPIYTNNIISPQIVISIVLNVYNKKHCDILKNNEIKQVVIWLLMKHCFKNVSKREEIVASIIGTYRQNVQYHLAKINERLVVVNGNYAIDKKFYNYVYGIDNLIENEKIQALKKR